jgi:hypothetical protein
MDQPDFDVWTALGVDYDSMIESLDDLLRKNTSVFEQTEDSSLFYPFAGAAYAVLDQQNKKRMIYGASYKWHGRQHRRHRGLVLQQKGFLKAGSGAGTGGAFAGVGSFGVDPLSVIGRTAETHIGFFQLWPLPPLGQAVIHWNGIGTYTGVGPVFVGGIATGLLPFTRA